MTQHREKGLPDVPDLPLWEAQLPVLVRGLGPGPGEARAGRASGAGGQGPPGEQLRDDALVLAQQEARNILRRAQEEAQAIPEETRRETRRQLTPLLLTGLERALGLIREDLQAQFGARMRETEADAARLCLELAETVIRRKIAEDDSIVVEAVRQGLARIPNARKVVVRVSPRCVAALREAEPELSQDLPFETELEITADESVSPGGAVLQGSSGEVDLQIEAQFARLRRAAEAAILLETEEARLP